MSEWLYYQHPETHQIARVHITDKGKVALYERWGWIEINDPIGPVPHSEAKSDHI